METLVGAIIETHRRRVDLHRAEKRLTLQMKALCRRAAARKAGGLADLKDAQAIYAAAVDGKGEHDVASWIAVTLEPLVAARDVIEGRRMEAQRELEKLAKRLPVFEWVESVRGVGALALGQVVGEAGDLANYPNHRHLWKRMGLAVMADGRQRKVTGAAAIEHGYSPERRSIIWNIGDAIIRAGSGHYRTVYDERKEYELKAATEAGLVVLPAAKIPKAEAHRYRSEGYIHNRAKRYMEKRFLKDLWAEWRRRSERAFA